MKIRIYAKPGSKQEGVERRADGVWIVRVRARAVDGKANDAIIKSLAEYFGCRMREVTIISGSSSKNKIVDLPKNTVFTQI